MSEATKRSVVVAFKNVRRTEKDLKDILMRAFPNGSQINVKGKRYFVDGIESYGDRILATNPRTGNLRKFYVCSIDGYGDAF